MSNPIFKILLAITLFLSSAIQAMAAPYAAIVMDARDGKVLFSTNANQPLHPASLTKMMTLYIAFAEISAGRISMEQDVLISSNAASKPPSKMGLRAGSTMKMKYLLRAAAIKSANDAATAIAEAIGGSEARFAQYMTQTAAQLGMKNTRFQNPHGLTQNGHYSTAQDMAVLGRHLIYDYPEYYKLFSTEYADTPLGQFGNSNIRFLKDYPGADGIKTGYTQAAGHNLVATAQRGRARVLVSMFGGQSSYQRNQQIGALLDLGFQRAPASVKVSNISRPRLSGIGGGAPAPVQAAIISSTTANPIVETITPKPATPNILPVPPKTAGLAPKFATRPIARVAVSTPKTTTIASTDVTSDILSSLSTSAASTSTTSRVSKPVARPASLNASVSDVTAAIVAELATTSVQRPVARPK